MAKRNYLVEGLSGVGKSWVYEELIRRGYRAISADRAWAYNADPETGMPGGPVGHDSWVWERSAAVRELARPEPEVLFVCGSNRNSDQFLPYFTKVFNLQIDVTRCVTDSKREPTTIGRLAKRELSSCLNSIGRAKS